MSLVTSIGRLVAKSGIAKKVLNTVSRTAPAKVTNPLFTEFINKAGHTEVSLYDLMKQTAKSTGTKQGAENAAVKIVRAQKQPEGIVKGRLDLIMDSFQRHIRNLNEDRCYFNGTGEEFSKSLQESYKELKANYPEYSDYISKHLDSFMSKY